MNRKMLSLIQAAWIALTFVLAITWRAEALLLLVFLAILGPSLREVGLVTGIDERKRALDQQASHYAFILLYVLLITIFAHALFVEGTNPDSRWYLVLVAPVVVRGTFYLGRGEGARRLGLGLGFTFGAAWILFTSISHGLSTVTAVELVIGGSIIGATALALRWPRVGGAMLILIGLFFTLVVSYSQSERTAATAVLQATLLPLPPFVAGISLFLSGCDEVKEVKEVKDEFADLRPLEEEKIGE